VMEPIPNRTMARAAAPIAIGCPPKRAKELIFREVSSRMGLQKPDVICNSSEYHRLRDAKTGDLPVDYHISPESPLESGFSEAMRI
jgi:hypothetical protein